MTEAQSQHIRSIDNAFTSAISLPVMGSKARLWLICSVLLSSLPIVFYIIFVCFLFVLGVDAALRFFPSIDSTLGFVFVGVYVVVLCFFSSFLLFLVRPFFNKPITVLSTALDEEKEPAIFHLANVLARKIGSEKIQAIHINNDVVVDVKYVTAKDLYEKKLTLVVGLPLLSLLSTKQLAGLIGRELAHYADRRIHWYYIALRFINSWLFRIAHEDDRWVQFLERKTEKNIIWSPLFRLTLIGSTLVGKIFNAFLSVVESITGTAIIDIELFADAVPAQILGSDHFGGLLKDLVRIDQSYHASLEKTLSDELVPENFADLVKKNYLEQTTESDLLIEMTRADQFNSWYFLPPPQLRCSNIEGIKAEGIFNLDLPFAALFFDMPAACKELSGLFYSAHGVDPSRIVKVTEEQKDSRKVSSTESKEALILKRFSSGLFRPDIVWDLSEIEKFLQLDEAKVAPFLNKVIVSIRHGLPELNKYMTLVDEYTKQKKLFHCYQWLVKDGSRNRPDAKVADAAKLFVADFEKQFPTSLATYRKFYGVRIAASLALGKSNRLFASARSLGLMLKALGPYQTAIHDAQIKCSTLQTLLKRRTDGDDVHDKTIARFTRMLLNVVQKLEACLQALPPALLKSEQDAAAIKQNLSLEKASSTDREHLVIERFLLLARCFGEYNLAISVKLAQFVEMVEKTHKIQSVVTVALK